MDTRVFETQFLEHMATVTLTIDFDGNVYTINRSYEYPRYPQNNRVEEPSTFTMERGVPRWVSNRQVPPSDTIREMYIDHVPGFDLLSTEQRRDKDMAKFVSAYRKAQPAVPSNEEMYELRANFEPGTVVVDVISGRRVRV